MPWFVYILLCDQKTYYVGLTSNLSRRLTSHNAKYNLATKEFSEINLVYFEKHASRYRSEKREKQIKGWSVAKKKALITGNKQELIRLSKSKTMSLVDGKPPSKW